MLEGLGLGLLLGVGFWPILTFLIIAVLLFPVVESERAGLAFLTIAIGAALAQFLYGFNIFGYVVNEPWAAFTWIVVYIGFGIGYSFVRWNSFCANWRKEYEELQADVVRNSYNANTRLKYSWDHRPQANTSKKRITTWMMFWPWSSFWWFFSDFIVNFFNAIYDRLAKVYTNIAARHMEGLSEPAAPAPPKDWHHNITP